MKRTGRSQAQPGRGVDLCKLVAGTVALSCLVGGTEGCGAASLRYSTDTIARIPADGSPLVVAEPVDARNNGSPAVTATFPGGKSAEELLQLREAVRHHVARSGLANSLMPAPKSAAEVDTALDAAAKAGAHEVVFLRFLGSNSSGVSVNLDLCWACGLLPTLVFDSLYLSRHAGTGMFEAVAIDPQSRELLVDAMRMASFGEHVSAWGYGPNDLMNEMVRDAVGAVLADVVAARKAGYPTRKKVDSVESLVIGGPWIRSEEGKLSGPGFSVGVPAGWKQQLHARALFKLVSPDNVRFVGSWEPTFANTDEFANGFEKHVPGRVVSRTPSTLGSRPAVTFEETLTGENVTTRVISVGGMGFGFSCSPAKERATCDQMFDSVRLDTVTRTDAPR
jgi:hypothetical protein